MIAQVEAVVAKNWDRRGQDFVVVHDVVTESLLGQDWPLVTAKVSLEVHHTTSKKDE